jgi:hypothetical protein
MKEGARVAYIGEPPEKGFAVGDEGRIIAMAGSGAHVQWASGEHSGEISITRLDDLTPIKRQARSFADTDGLLVTVAVRDEYINGGASGLLNALNDEGHMANWSQYAEDALQLVATRIRQDPSMAEVVAQLDDEEAEEVIATATLVLLRDAFSVSEATE